MVEEPHVQDSQAEDDGALVQEGAPPIPEGEASVLVEEVPEPASQPDTAGVPLSPVGAAPAAQYWGIDISYHRLTDDQCVALFESGVRVVFQCIWTGRERPDPAQDNIRKLDLHGFITCGYLSTSAGRTGLGHVQAGFDTLDLDVQRILMHVAIDHELEGYPFAVVRDAVDALRNRGFQPLVYTSYNAWVNILDNPTMPADWKIWNAFWDNDADYDFPRYPYGGKTVDDVIGEQYTGGEDVLGVNADRDLFQGWYFNKVEPEPEPPTPPQEDYVVHITQTFNSGKVWEFDVVPPPWAR